MSEPFGLTGLYRFFSQLEIKLVFWDLNGVKKNPESSSETTTDLETWNHGPMRYVDGSGYIKGRSDTIVMEASSGKKTMKTSNTIKTTL